MMSRYSVIRSSYARTGSILLKISPTARVGLLGQRSSKVLWVGGVHAETWGLRCSEIIIYEYIYIYILLHGIRVCKSGFLGANQSDDRFRLFEVLGVLDSIKLSPLFHFLVAEIV